MNWKNLESSSDLISSYTRHYKIVYWLAIFRELDNYEPTISLAKEVKHSKTFTLFGLHIVPANKN
jgi:hypothetical protein